MSRSADTFATSSRQVAVGRGRGWAAKASFRFWGLALPAMSASACVGRTSLDSPLSGSDSAVFGDHAGNAGADVQSASGDPRGDGAGDSTSEGVPNKLVISDGSTSATAGSCTAQFTVTTEDSFGNATVAGTTVSLASTGSGGFYSDANCTLPVPGSTLAISAGSSSGYFYVNDNVAETVTLTASGALAAGAASVTFTPPATLATIYRSVGPGNTSALGCGTTSGACTGQGDLTISDITGTATFASLLRTNIGVGDAVVYDCSCDAALGAGDCVAFISARTDGGHFTLQDARGGPPAAYGPGAVWEIYRAYTSLDDAVGHVHAGTENAALADFDPWSGARDLRSTNEQWNVALYADGVDTTPVSIQGWTTTATNYLRIFTPSLPTEVAASQRHNGVWGIWGYALSVNDIHALDSAIDNLWLDGLQAQGTLAANNDTATLDIRTSGAASSTATPSRPPPEDLPQPVMHRACTSSRTTSCR